MQFSSNISNKKEVKFYSLRENFNNKIHFGVFVVCIIIFNVFLIHVLNQYILGKEVYLRSYTGRLSSQSIEVFLNLKKQNWWSNYIFFPFILLIKVSFSSICVGIAAVFSNIDFKFKNIFKVSLLAESVFIFAQIIYLINLYIHLDTLTLETVSNYYPLTALSWFGTEKVVNWLQYPLHTLNAFEILYMIVIAWLLSKQWKEDFMESLALVVPSYGTGLILWLVFVTFITLQIS